MKRRRPGLETLEKIAVTVTQALKIVPLFAESRYKSIRTRVLCNTRRIRAAKAGLHPKGGIRFAMLLQGRLLSYRLVGTFASPESFRRLYSEQPDEFARQHNMTEYTQGRNQKILGILQAGRAPEEIIDRFPDYNGLFVDLLGEDAFNYRTWAVLENEFPHSIDEADAWLITGSRHGAYEPHSWIPPLEALIREIYAKGAPMVGICFGHQIIAQALGGKVEKFDGGWSVGRVEYSLDPDVFPHSSENALTPLMAFHQDQVVEIPDGAVNVGSTSFCKNAALLYDSRILTIQPHPEFSYTFTNELLQARGEILPPHILQSASATLHEPVDSAPVAEALRKFLMQSA